MINHSGGLFLSRPSELLEMVLKRQQMDPPICGMSFNHLSSMNRYDLGLHGFSESSPIDTYSE